MPSFESKIPKPVNDVTQSPFANKKPEPLLPDIMEEENKLSAAKDNDVEQQQFSNEPGAEQKPEQQSVADENAEIDPVEKRKLQLEEWAKEDEATNPTVQRILQLQAWAKESAATNPTVLRKLQLQAWAKEDEATNPTLLRKLELQEWAKASEATDPIVLRKLELQKRFSLSVSQPDDAKELEADKKSEEVTSPPGQETAMPSLLTCRTGGSNVGGDRRSEADALPEGERNEARYEETLAAKSSSGGEVAVNRETKDYINNLPAGQSLPLKIKNFFQTRFGRSFNKVKIHNDRQANEAAAAINAKAFTKGNDIVFGEGQYQPDTNEGKKLMAHELTHVAQQGGKTEQIQRYVLPTDWCDYIGLGIDIIERIYIELAYEEGDEKDFQRFVNNLFFVIDGVLAATPGAGGGGLVLRGSRSMAAAGWGAIPVSVKITIAEKLAKKMGWTTAKALQMANRFFSVAANSGGGAGKDNKGVDDKNKESSGSKQQTGKGDEVINSKTVLEGMSNNNLKHSIKHIDEFQKLDPKITPDSLRQLGASLVKPKNLISQPNAKQKVYEAIIRIGGKKVKVRSVLNRVDKLHGIHIRYK